MSDFITLSCPSCGAKLEITQDINRFACSHCGQEHIVKRSGGIVSLSPVIDAINQVKSGVDKTAAELAIIRLQKEIKELESQKGILLKSAPPPLANGGILIACILGLAITFCATSFVEDSTARGVFIAIGVIAFTVVGIVFIQKYPKDKARWEKTTGENIKFLNAQIAQKTLELKHFQDMVSSK